LNKPEYNLSNNDIKGSQPQQNKFTTTREASNPLEPKYRLSKVEFVAPDPPRFVRDSINIDDLDKARPKIMLPPDLVERDVFKVKDIEGTAPKKQYQRGTAHDT
jgi:hypothetical protein